MRMKHDTVGRAFSVRYQKERSSREQIEIVRPLYSFVSNCDFSYRRIERDDIFGSFFFVTHKSHHDAFLLMEVIKV
jgi:hypothetical protein